MADSSDLSLSLDHARILTLLNSTRIPIKNKTEYHSVQRCPEGWLKESWRTLRKSKEPLETQGTSRNNKEPLKILRNPKKPQETLRALKNLKNSKNPLEP